MSTIDYKQLGWESARRLMRYNTWLFRAFWIMYFALLGAMLAILLFAGRAEGVSGFFSLPTRLPSPSRPANDNAAGVQADRRRGPIMTGGPAQQPRRKPVSVTGLDGTHKATKVVSRARVSAAAIESETTPAVVGTQERVLRAGKSPSLPTIDIYDRTVDYIHFRESNYGKDPRSKRGVVGKAGEKGEWQITPIFERDIYRLFQVNLDPYDNLACRKYIRAWLEHYRPNTTSVAELYKIYNQGP